MFGVTPRPARSKDLKGAAQNSGRKGISVDSVSKMANDSSIRTGTASSVVMPQSLSRSMSSMSWKESRDKKIGHRMRSWQTALPRDRLGRDRLGVTTTSFTDSSQSPLLFGMVMRPGSNMFHRMDSRPYSPFDCAYSSKPVQPNGMNFIKSWSCLPAIVTPTTPTSLEEQKLDICYEDVTLGSEKDQEESSMLRQESPMVRQESTSTSSTHTFSYRVSFEEFDAPGMIPQEKGIAHNDVEPQKRTSMASVCPSCGNVFMVDANFCRKCGTARPIVDGHDAAPTEKTDAPRLHPTMRRRGTVKQRRRSSADDSSNVQVLPKAQVIDAFRRLSKGSGELSSDAKDLVQVFRAGGCAFNINEAWLIEAVRDDCQGRSAVDMDDFDAIVENYEIHLKEQFYEVYWARCAKDGSVLAWMLPEMLRYLGVVAVPGAVLQTVMRLTNSPHANREQEISYKLFIDVHWELYKQVGLHPSEYDRLVASFNRYAEGDAISHSNVERSFHLQPLFRAIVRSEQVQVRIRQAIRLFRIGAVQLDPFRWEYDSNQYIYEGSRVVRESNHVTLNIYLLIARMIHEDAAATLKKKAELLCCNENALDASELRRLFSEIGSVSPCLPELLSECTGSCGLQDHRKFDFGGAYTIFLRFCEVEGLTSHERQELSDLFVTLTEKLKDSMSHAGSLSTTEIGRALRWLAYVPSEYRLYDFMEDSVELNELQFLSLNDFIRVLVEYRHSCIGSAYKKGFAGNSSQLNKTVHVDRLYDLLAIAGQNVSDHHFDELLEGVHAQDDYIDWDEFVRLEHKYRLMLKETLKHNQGFIDTEVAHYAEFFKEKDPRDTGLIPLEEMSKYIKKHLPQVTFAHQEYRKLHEEADFKNYGKVRFNEFLWILRRLTDRVERERITNATDSRKRLGFSRAEVAQIRELFNLTDVDKSGDVDFRELQNILSSLVSMVGEAVRELRSFMNQVDTNGDGVLDFWEFLQLFRILQDRNWRNINGVAEGNAMNMA